VTRIPAAVALLAVLALAGCTLQPIPLATPFTTPSANATATATPTAAPTSAPAPGAAALCNRNVLKITYAATDNSAGQQHGILTFTNFSGDPCHMYGWPAVWFDNPEAQQPMGAQSLWDQSAAPDFIIAPGGTGTATVTITQAGFVDGCTVVQSIALLVIPPMPEFGSWSDWAQHVDIPSTDACTQSSIGLITTGSVIPG